MKKENQMIITEKAIYRLKAIFIKIPMQFFTQIVKKKILNFICTYKIPRIVKTIINKNNKNPAVAITTPDFKL